MTEEIDNSKILDLSDLAPKRQQVRFEENGPLYDMASPVEMTINQRAELWALHRRMEKLTEKNVLKVNEVQEMKQAVDKAARIVLPEVDNDVIEGLPDFQKEAVVLGFINAFGNTIKRLAEETGGEEMAQALATLSES
jgi:hypothetical protein